MTDVPHFSLPFRFGDGSAFMEGFDRPGTDAPPSRAWTPLGYDAGMESMYGPIALSGDGRTATAAVPWAVAGSACLWALADFPGDVDLWVTVTEFNPVEIYEETVALIACWSAPDSSYRLGYWHGATGGGEVTLITPGAGWPPAEGADNFPDLRMEVGDQLGLRVLLSESPVRIEARHRPAGGSWRTFGYWLEDEPPPGATVGLMVGEGNKVDDFGVAPVGAYPDEHPQAAAVEQDSLDEIADCCLAVLSCPTGFRVELPDFGIDDPAFTTVDTEQLRRALETWEPRAQAEMTEEQIDELALRVKVMLRLRSET